MTGPSEYPRLVDPERDRLADQHRQPPHNIPVEQALLGAVLVNNEALHRVSGFLLAEHFFEPAHGRIYEAMTRLIERGQLASPITLAHFFERDEGLKDVGGAQYLARLAASMVSVLDTEDYGRTTFDLYLRRAAIAAFQSAIAQAYDPRSEEPAAEIIGHAIAELDRIADGGPDRDPVVTIGDAWLEARQHAEAVYKGEVSPGLMTGFRDLDTLLNGLQDGDSSVIAGRPSMGKTALAWAAAERVAARGDRVVFFSLEMSTRQLAYRSAAAQLNVPASVIARPSGHSILAAAARIDMQNMPIDIVKSSGITFHALRGRALQLTRRNPARLVVVDHIGLMRPSAETLRAGRVQQIAEITQGLKNLAGELGCPVLALSQLSREVERRDDKRPMLSDLRDSGTIEQDADQVMFVYRDEYYLDRTVPSEDELAQHEKALAEARNVMEVLVAKNRNGPTGVAKLYCNIAANKIGDLARQDPLL